MDKREKNLREPINITIYNITLDGIINGQSLNNYSVFYPEILYFANSYLKNQIPTRVLFNPKEFSQFGKLVVDLKQQIKKIRKELDHNHPYQIIIPEKYKNQDLPATFVSQDGLATKTITGITQNEAERIDQEINTMFKWDFINYSSL